MQDQEKAAESNLMLDEVGHPDYHSIPIPDSDDDTISDVDYQELIDSSSIGKNIRDISESEEEDLLIERQSVAIKEKWSVRLGQLPATQGIMSSEVDDAGEVSLKVRPTWPDWLTDITFDVVKTNRFGHRQRRQLRLTKHHILNIKGGKEVSRLHPYDQISRVYLIKSDKFIVEFNEEENCRRLDYKSDDAVQIVQQISTRIKVWNDLIKTCPEALLSERSSSWRDSSSKERSPSPVIVSSEKHDRHDNIVEFSRCLGILAKHVCEDILGVAVIPCSSEQRVNATCMRAVNMIPSSNEFMVKRSVESILLSNSTAAGSTRKQFIEKYKLNEEGTAPDLLDLRHFIDGMYGYVLKHHLKQLFAVLLQHNTQNKSDNVTAKINEHDLIQLSYIVFTVVEASLFTPLHKCICTRYFEEATNMVSCNNSSIY
jgi:hypothetical protein